MQTDHDVDNWHTVEYVFPVGDLAYITEMRSRGQTELTQVHFMVEANDFDCEGTMVPPARCFPWFWAPLWGIQKCYDF